MRRNAARAAPALLAALLPAACGRAPPPAPAPVARYTLENAWRSADGAWFYPHERLDGGFTGLATAMAGTSRPGGIEADGARLDPAYPAAAVQSLQLPVVLRVTDLLDGRQVLVRADDRGPASPARAIALDRRAMALLGMDPAAPTPVRVEIDPGLSALAERGAAGAPTLQIATAPTGTVRAVPLGPPGSAAPAVASPGSGAGLSPGGGAPDAPDDPAAALPQHLPQTVTTVPVGPVSLAVDLGRFTDPAVAREIAGRAGAAVVPDGAGRAATYAVRAGPFADVAAADAALDRARRAGISGARITAVGG